MQFTAATAGRIVFGPGSYSRLVDEISGMGNRVLVVRGKRLDHVQPLLDTLKKRLVPAVCLEVRGEPDTGLIAEGAALGRQSGVNVIVAIGGGSVIDAGKALSALIPNPGEVLDYLEGIGNGKPLGKNKVPFLAVPTTAGTGAEATCNAVILSRPHRVKVSLRHPGMFPNLALVDPELTLSLPSPITAQTGFDALTQLIEPFVSPAGTVFTDALCREGLALVRDSLSAAYRDPDDSSAREGMSLASLLSGVALSNAKLGAVHGIAGPLGGLAEGPHGALCAALLAVVMEENVAALSKRDPENRALSRYREIARILTRDEAAEPVDGIAWIRCLKKEMEIPGLSRWGVKQELFADLAARAAVSSSMKGNPVRFSEQELIRICRKALDQ